MNQVRRALLPLSLGLLVSCAAIGKSLGKREPDPNWQTREIQAPSDRVLWKISLLAVEKMGFPLAGGLDPSAGEIKSGWQTHLAPFGRKGYRMRAEVRLSPLERGRWQVETRVARQINDAIVAPLDPSRADWKWEPDDAVQALILLQHISVAFVPDLELPEEGDGDPLDAYLKSVEESRP